MQRIPFLMKLTGDRAAGVASVRALRGAFEDACARAQVRNFSIWRMEQYLFGYGESVTGDARCFDAILENLPAGVALVCAPGSMRQMYHDIGVVREDKRLIRHRVFATKLKPGCAEEYKRRHDGLVAARGDRVTQGPESNFTIWNANGYIFGYCELVKSYDHELTEEEKAQTIAWETRQLEIMDWYTDDVDWITGEKHEKIQNLFLQKGYEE